MICFAEQVHVFRLGKRRFVSFSALLCLLAALAVPSRGVHAQEETVFKSYERIFIRSSLGSKVNVLSDAANDEDAALFYGPLCKLALDFAVENVLLFRDDPDILSIAVTAVRGIGNHEYIPATEVLWQAFLCFPDNLIRYEILDVLPIMDTQSLTPYINEFLVDQYRNYNSGLPSDYRLLSALFAILADTGDESSYPVLFSSSRLYSGELKDEAIKALYGINGDFSGFCIKVILNNPLPEKLAAFNLAVSRDELSAEKKAELAEAALETVLAIPGDRRSEVLELTEKSLLLIQEAEWVRSLPHVIKYYTQCHAAFRADRSLKQALLNAIACMGALKSAEAARPLALDLSLYNSRYAALANEDYEVVLALINALGKLGYKASYDILRQAGSLDYPGTIREAAQKTLNMLQW